MSSTKSQNARVLSHLVEHGYITPVIAQNYGIRRLAARVLELKQQYVDIQTELRTDDSGSRYAYYTVSESVRNNERTRIENGFSWRVGSAPQQQAA